MICEFSERVAASHCEINRNGSLLAIVHGSRLTLRDALSLEAIQVHSCVDRIDRVSFSPDGTLVLCSMKARGVVQIFNAGDPSYNARIDEGVVGFVDCFWAPDSRHILLESDFGIHLTIASLITSTSSIISNPKNVGSLNQGNGGVSQLASFSDCRRFMAVVHKKELRDYIGLYSMNPWDELAKFPCTSNDVSAVFFVPQSTQIVTIDSPLSYNVSIYSPSGVPLASITAYNNALGVRQVAFHRLPTSLEDAIFSGVYSTASQVDMKGRQSADKALNLSPFILIASFDSKVRAISLFSWQIVYIFNLTHPRDMEVAQVDYADRVHPTMLVEVPAETSDANAEASVMKFGSKTNTNNQTVNSETTHVAKMLKALPKINQTPGATGNGSSTGTSASSLTSRTGHPPHGVSWLAMSADGRLAAAREESQPRCLWIFDLQNATLITVIVQLEAIVSSKWLPNPREEPLLAFCTASSRIYFWSMKSGVIYSDMDPAQAFAVTSLSWNPSGCKTIGLKKEIQLVLMGRENICNYRATLSNDETENDMEAK